MNITASVLREVFVEGIPLNSMHTKHPKQDCIIWLPDLQQSSENMEFPSMLLLPALSIVLSNGNDMDLKLTIDVYGVELLHLSGPMVLLRPRRTLQKPWRFF